MKLMTVVGTRPELIKLSRVIPVLDANFDHVLVHTGQNYDYELNKIFFDELKIRSADEYLNVEGDTPAQLVANVIEKTDEMLLKHEPDAVLFYGDTNSVLGCYAAKRRQISIFHMEAGNRSFNALVPEETNRKIIDHLADINMVNSEHARRHLLAEGILSDRIIKIGSPMKEVLVHNMLAIESSDVLQRLSLELEKYFVVSMHREANVDDTQQLSNWVSAFNMVAEVFDVPLIFSCHPRTQKRLSASGLFLDERIRIMLPLGFADYCALQRYALCTISDSGTVTEEASILNFPAVTIRKAHERPEGMDEATVTMVGDPLSLIEAIKFKIHQFHGMGGVEIVTDYDVHQVSQKVANTILSYIDFVNRVVWHKY